MNKDGWRDPEEVADAYRTARRPVGIRVTLSDLYLRRLSVYAAKVAQRMRRTGRHNAQGFHDTNVTAYVGACGEAAFLQVHSIEHPMYLGPDGAEDFLGFQVRTTKLKDGCLWTYEYEEDDLRLVLVIADEPDFLVRGTATAGMVRRYGTKKAGRGRKKVYYLAQKYLRPYDRQADLFT